MFAFTAPYARVAPGAAPPPHPGYDQARERKERLKRAASPHAHPTGGGVPLRFRPRAGRARRGAASGRRARRARGAREAFPSLSVGTLTPRPRREQAAVAHGGDSVLEPVELAPDFVMCELRLYGDVVLRLLSYSDGCDTPFLPGYAHASSSPPPAPAGLRRLDHVVGNVPCLSAAVEYLSSLSGFHEFAEFAAADVGTSESGLNSVVLASADERVLLPINEPVLGTKRRSQIQTFLEQHPGPGVQHLAIASDDIFASVAAMRAAPCGFEFLRAAGDAYYAAAPERVGAHVLSEAQWAACRREGVLIDRDDRGVLLQLFTRPVGDRATLFLEVIQRIGCEGEGPGGVGQAGGCGGFGKGNFAALFKSVEDEERLRTL